MERESSSSQFSTYEPAEFLQLPESQEMKNFSFQIKMNAQHELMTYSGFLLDSEEKQLSKEGREWVMQENEQMVFEWVRFGYAKAFADFFELFKRRYEKKIEEALFDEEKKSLLIEFLVDEFTPIVYELQMKEMNTRRQDKIMKRYRKVGRKNIVKTGKKYM